MEGFALRDGVYVSSMGDGEVFLLRQLATRALVVLDDPGEYTAISSVVNAVTEIEQCRDEPCERALRMLLFSIGEGGEDAGRLRVFTEDSLRADKSVCLRVIVDDLDHIVHGGSGTLRVQPEAVQFRLDAPNDIRLGLASKLDLSDSHDTRRIEELTLSEPTGEHLQTVVAIYMLIAWRQDSLLKAVSNSQ